MPFEVSANPVAMSIYNNLAVQQSSAATALAKVSSGDKATDPSLAASVGAGTSLRSSLVGTQTAITSTQNAINTLRVADGAYGQALGLAQQGLGIAQGRSAVGADTSAVDAQLASISAGIAGLASTTQYNGMLILGTPLAVSVNASGETVSVTPDAIPAVADSGNRVADFAAAANAISESRAKNAGNLASLQGNLQVLQVTVANQQAAVGQVLDPNVAKEMMSLTSANIMSDGAVAMMAQAMNMPGSVLKLL